MDKMFSAFPKKRSQLPPEFEAIYSAHYKENREGGSKASSLSQKLESWMHRKVAEDVKCGARKSTLEIGAGTLNHIPYEPHSAPYDIVEPFRDLYTSSPNSARVSRSYGDVFEVPYESKYERIISIAAFEHICNLPEVVAQSALLLTVGGQLRVSVPSEGTILWRLGWSFTTGLEFRLRHRLDYGVLMKHEHVNSAKEIEDVLRYFFSEVTTSVYGVARSLSLYQFYACTRPRLDRCVEWGL